MSSDISNSSNQIQYCFQDNRICVGSSNNAFVLCCKVEKHIDYGLYTNAISVGILMVTVLIISLVFNCIGNTAFSDRISFCIPTERCKNFKLILIIIIWKISTFLVFKWWGSRKVFFYWSLLLLGRFEIIVSLDCKIICTIQESISELPFVYQSIGISPPGSWPCPSISSSAGIFPWLKSGSVFL